MSTATVAEGLVIPVDFAKAVAAGAVTYWRLSGPVSYARLAAAWKAAGLPEKELPRTPSAETILRRAVGELQERRRRIEPLARRGAWAVVDVACDRETDDLDFTVAAKVYYRSKTETAPAGLDIDTNDEKLAQQIRESFDEQQDALQPTDISAWLIKRVEGLQAVSLRDSGGVYFVPRQTVATWRAICTVVESVTSHAVFKIPALPNSEAAKAILDAIVTEVGSVIGDIDAELDLPTAERIGRRALAGRSTACADMLGKVGTYEQLLGRPIDDLREKIIELQVRITAAALVASGDALEVAE
jgi:hypothetical protein